MEMLNYCKRMRFVLVCRHMSAEHFSPKEDRREGDLFPISKVAVESALFSISIDPPAKMNEEYGLLGERNPSLKRFLLSQMQEYDDENASREFFEGALWSHKILRYNLPSHQLPVLSETISDSIYNVAVAEHPEKTFKEICADKLMKVFRSEENLEAGIKEMTRYKTSNIDFYFGSYTVIGSFGKQEEIRKLNASLGLE